MVSHSAFSSLLQTARLQVLAGRRGQVARSWRLSAHAAGSCRRKPETAFVWSPELAPSMPRFLTRDAANTTQYLHCFRPVLRRIGHDVLIVGFGSYRSSSPMPATIGFDVSSRCSATPGQLYDFSAAVGKIELRRSAQAYGRRVADNT